MDSEGGFFIVFRSVATMFLTRKYWYVGAIMLLCSDEI